MPFECQQSIVAHHAAAVVGYLYEFLSARLHADLDASRSSIERVLEHLFHNGRRPLHHLARGDLVGNGIGKYVDLSHADESLVGRPWSVAPCHDCVHRAGRLSRCACSAGASSPVKDHSCEASSFADATTIRQSLSALPNCGTKKALSARRAPSCMIDSYCTLSVMAVAGLVYDPDVPVTLIVYCPFGVPGFEVEPL